jgi:hypothetical protein
VPAYQSIDSIYKLMGFPAALRMTEENKAENDRVEKLVMTK